MRQSIIIGKTSDGQWVTLALPDVPVDEQSAFLKQLRCNGGVIELNGQPVKLEEAQQLILGAGKKAKFKQEEPAAEEPKGVTSLKELQAALGIEDGKVLDALRKAEGFPCEKDERGCYDVAAIREFMTAGEPPKGGTTNEED